eukprot:scaffold1411_cov125-Isochrysis_galbana.AAC.11
MSRLRAKRRTSHGLMGRARCRFFKTTTPAAHAERSSTARSSGFCFCQKSKAKNGEQGRRGCRQLSAVPAHTAHATSRPKARHTQRRAHLE